MSFIKQLIEAKKKSRNKIPKKGTISYYKYLIAKANASKKPRVEKLAAIRRYEAKIEQIREGKFDRKLERMNAASAKYHYKEENMKLTIARLSEENAELRRLLGLAPSLDDDEATTQFIAAIKSFGCSLNGGNSIKQHKHKLPSPFDQWSLRKVQELIRQLIKFKRLSRLPCGLIM